MGTEAIAFSSSDITALQNDVNELNTKLNALIVEFNKCSDDTTINKGKINDLLDKISDGYSATQTTGTGAATDSILTRLSHLDEDYKNLSDDVDGLMTGGRTASRGSGGTAGQRSIDITATTGTGVDTSVNASSASVTGTYGTGDSVVTLGSKGEIKARKLARKTLNSLRK
jgi:ElaB/YqjD/DUF883 family membrane-anchored ribosome-binding protein